MKKFIAVTQSVGWAIGWVIFTAFFAGWDIANALKYFGRGDVGLGWLNLGIGIFMGVLLVFWVREVRRRYTLIVVNAYRVGRSDYVVTELDK